MNRRAALVEAYQETMLLGDYFPAREIAIDLWVSTPNMRSRNKWRLNMHYCERLSWELYELLP